MKKGKKPRINKHPVIVPCDVDLTLIDYKIDDKDPRLLIEVGLVPGKEIKVFPILEHIEAIKNHRASGAYIRIWSGSGYEWAAHIVEKLGLTEYVDEIETKFKWYLDDVDVTEWAKRLYRYEPYKK